MRSCQFKGRQGLPRRSPDASGAVPAAALLARHRRKDAGPKAEHRRKAGVLNSMAAGPAGRALRAA
ncbi:hypothetical protein FT673_02050 [Aeromonas hydrophila]|nr:hypothetical protein FT673_02050 [Aeromonas hydrophila]